MFCCWVLIHSFWTIWSLFYNLAWVSCKLFRSICFLLHFFFCYVTKQVIWFESLEWTVTGVTHYYISSDLTCDCSCKIIFYQNLMACLVQLTWRLDDVYRLYFKLVVFKKFYVAFRCLNLFKKVVKSNKNDSNIVSWSSHCGEF